MSRNKNNLIKQTTKLFSEKFSQTPEVVSISPGRINLNLVCIPNKARNKSKGLSILDSTISYEKKRYR